MERANPGRRQQAERPTWYAADKKRFVTETCDGGQTLPHPPTPPNPQHNFFSAIKSKFFVRQVPLMWQIKPVATTDYNQHMASKCYQKNAQKQTILIGFSLV